MSEQKPEDDHASPPAAPARVRMQVKARWVDWNKHFWMLVGVLLFCIVYFSPPFPTLTDPGGVPVALTHEGKAALGLFLLAATWWVFEVIPIGVTGIAIGVIQILFLIRSKDSAECAKAAFGNFMDPAVWFIIGSITFGMVFSKTGLTRRMAYRMLVTAGERTSMIYLARTTRNPRSSAKACSSAWRSWPARAASSRCWARPAARWRSGSSRTSSAARCPSSS
jgi:hypothetical protein